MDYETTEHRFILDVLIGNVLIFTFSCYSFLKYTFFFFQVFNQNVSSDHIILEKENSEFFDRFVEKTTLLISIHHLENREN